MLFIIRKEILMGITSYASRNLRTLCFGVRLSMSRRDFYVDYRCARPAVDSVSLAFYEHGWRGVNVDRRSNITQTLLSWLANEIG